MQTTLNDKLLDIWERSFPDNASVLQPLYFDEMQKNSVLFVGMNPSFNEKVMNNILAEARPRSDENAQRFFSWRGRGRTEESICIGEQRRSKLEYSYYKFHRLVLAETNIKWDQIDLYRYRASNQKNMLEVCNKNPEFKERSVDLFFDALKEINPKALIVLNAKVSEFLKNTVPWGGDCTHGHHWIEIHGRVIPTIFSGQFSGHSMAKPNRELLIWHTKAFLNRLATGAMQPPATLTNHTKDRTPL